MARRLLGASGLSVLAFVLFAVPIAGQAPVIPKPPKAPKAGWTPPKTPWGDPDIQGNFTNKYEQGTPMERPAGFEGRKADDARTISPWFRRGRSWPKNGRRSWLAIPLDESAATARSATAAMMARAPARG